MGIRAVVTYRILSLATTYSLNLVRGSRAKHDRARMMNDPRIARETNEMGELISDEMFVLLMGLEMLVTEAKGNIELENVGPDCDVNDFGKVVTSGQAKTAHLQRDAMTTGEAFIMVICFKVPLREFYTSGSCPRVRDGDQLIRSSISTCLTCPRASPIRKLCEIMVPV